MIDNNADVSAMREKLRTAQHEADSANTLRSCTNEINIAIVPYRNDPHPGIQKIVEILSHYKI